MSQIRMTAQVAGLIGTPATDNTKKTGVFFIEEVSGQLVPKTKDSDGNISTLQGPPGIGLTIVSAVDIKNPTELSAITITTDELFLVHEGIGETPNHNSTLYLGITSRPFSENIPFIINDALAGQFLAISGRFSINGSTFNGFVKRMGRGTFFNSIAYTFLLDATDEVIPLNSENADNDSSVYTLDDANDEIDLLIAGVYRLTIESTQRAILSTTYRMVEIFAEKATDIGAFTELPRSRSKSNVRTNRNMTTSRTIEFTAAKNDRLRFIGNASIQANNTDIEDINITLELVGE